MCPVPLSIPVSLPTHLTRAAFGRPSCFLRQIRWSAQPVVTQTRRRQMPGQAAAGRYCCQAGGIVGAAIRMNTVGPGAVGRVLGCILISRGRRLPLRRLQEAQEATMFSQTDLPPRLRGITWSTVSPGLLEPQY